MKYILAAFIVYILFKGFFPSGLNLNQSSQRNPSPKSGKQTGQDGDYVEYEDITDEK
ncbi:MAG: hypothetical protein IPK25_00440 [Saprospiraceae bacterium]|nr:hypothetical protein [Saprospiraceae bacterium]